MAIISRQKAKLLLYAAAISLARLTSASDLDCADAQILLVSYSNPPDDPEKAKTLAMLLPSTTTGSPFPSPLVAVSARPFDLESFC